jgi:opacity protein-like surface antigen
MSNKIFTRLSGSLLILLFLKSLFLCGGERQGFIYSLDLGYGFTKYPEKMQYWSSPESSENITKGGISMVGKMGYAPNNHLMILFLSPGIYFREETDSDKKILLNGLLSLGVSYYLNEFHPSFYFDAGAGLAIWYFPFEFEEDIGDLDMHLGFGGTLGVGYEFTHRWSIESNFSYSHFSFARDNVDITANTLFSSIVIRYIFY